MSNEETSAPTKIELGADLDESLDAIYSAAATDMESAQKFLDQYTKDEIKTFAEGADLVEGGLSGLNKGELIDAVIRGVIKVVRGDQDDNDDDTIDENEDGTESEDDEAAGGAPPSESDQATEARVLVIPDWVTALPDDELLDEIRGWMPDQRLKLPDGFDRNDQERYLSTLLLIRDKSRAKFPIPTPETYPALLAELGYQ